ncbi:HIT family protein [Sulfolobus acidocaldarius]|uniref:HIT family protein n=4 Tax=Sulfolobus acidocaldarius TaxID=2285 RepID=Q4JAT6_SULAC|nr:HIT domain-containing protein [Sulfolobus acidocaldarius]AAY80093.1 HIT family protein [Sulfolobus acidocaldarius DSM 639]AGE70662.1 HIT family protein [Sulfolobus acidocaldarius N8]AGE72935.1 HIT family protein [Sulfolobus acidocaldarius Ron12/I]ALU28992.1 HIT family hydrolase [Sulfolobus acidocaldarius]ALU31719.1 HIT family hydrolase [Sulfolobus acidocaldarius]
MDILWAPWRSKYVTSASKIKNEKEPCIFCNFAYDRSRDRENKVVFRATYSYIVLNTFPYNPGHIMIVPYKHVSSVELLDDNELTELFKMVRTSIKKLRRVYSPDGFNIGINIGRVAGAGIEQHVHIHIVPRWNGDANFMPVIGNAKVLPESLEDTYNKLYLEYTKDEEVLDR